MAIEEITSDFLRSLSGNCPEEVQDYLCFLFEGDEGLDLTLLEDSLVGSVPEFSFLPEKARKNALRGLISQVEGYKLSKLSLTSAEDKASGAPPEKASGYWEEAKRIATQTDNCICDSNKPGPDVSDDKMVEVAQLRELAPTVSDAFLRHVLEKIAKGDVQVAALWLLDSEDINSRQEAWEAAEKKAREQGVLAKQQERADRQRFFARYGLQVVTDDQRAKKGAKPAAKGPCKPEAAPKVRYREGRPVTTKGEKYVVERIGEEWDGGSKGKVYTKGKRGKGVV